jgi:hypothetical protein
VSVPVTARAAQHAKNALRKEHHVKDTWTRRVTAAARRALGLPPRGEPSVPAYLYAQALAGAPGLTIIDDHGSTGRDRAAVLDLAGVYAVPDVGTGEEQATAVRLPGERAPYLALAARCGCLWTDPDGIAMIEPAQLAACGSQHVRAWHRVRDRIDELAGVTVSELAGLAGPRAAGDARGWARRVLGATPGGEREAVGGAAAAAGELVAQALARGLGPVTARIAVAPRWVLAEARGSGAARGGFRVASDWPGGDAAPPGTAYDPDWWCTDCGCDGMRGDPGPDTCGCECGHGTRYARASETPEFA